MSETTQRSIDAQSRLSEKEMENEVLKKDKKLLLEELDHAKKRELKLVTVWEDKCTRLEESTLQKMSSFEIVKEKEYSERIQKIEDRLKTSEDTLDHERARFQAKKQQLEDRMSELEAKHKRENVSTSHTNPRNPYTRSMNPNKPLCAPNVTPFNPS
jgi:hypothetical protein